MKGIVFTEFFEMVEKRFGYEMVDSIIDESNLDSKGIYTSIGTYSHHEMVEIVSSLARKANLEPDFLLTEFGRYLFETFLKSYPHFFERVTTTFDFLSSIDSHIHVDVLKLYPKATLPKFDTKVEDQTMVMIYQSERKMSALALGLIEKSIEYYNEEYTIHKEDMNEEASQVKFIISPR